MTTKINMSATQRPALGVVEARVAVIAVIAVTAAGCGFGDELPTAKTPSPSPRDRAPPGSQYAETAAASTTHTVSLGASLSLAWQIVLGG